jgi:predicted RNA binding protein YcfA (HicA-like mRNA interferase family)
MNLSPKRLIKLLEQNGFVFKRTRGSHHLFHAPDKNITVIIPIHGKKDLRKGTFLAILKQAGIENRDI